MIPLSTLPEEPGVYFFKDKDAKIIYIGKAKNLRKRVSSYFNRSNQLPKTQLLVQNIAEIEFIVVDSEVEALLLENKQIKQHKPRYNIDLKDAKTYAYIGINNDRFPRIFSTRDTSNKIKLFGPYTDGLSRRTLLDQTVKLFQLRVCRTLPKRACLNYHIGLCTAPCIQNVSEEQYALQVHKAISFLRGNTKPIIKQLEQEMVQASEQKKYELALERKKTIEAINHLEEKQKVDLIKNFDQDVVVIKHDHSNPLLSSPEQNQKQNPEQNSKQNQEQKAVIVLFSISKGTISGKKEYLLDYDEELLSNFLSLYYSQNYVPQEIIINQELDNQEALEQYLAKLQCRKVIITHPQRGEKLALVELAEKNAALTIDNTILKDVQESLNLPNIPYVIECFDISNLGDEAIVAGMTQWINGRPNKNGYRKFEIKTIKKQDDFAAMSEVISRRYHRLKEENHSLPDLIIIDGGLGQLQAALTSLKKLALTIPIISLAKQEEEIYIPGQTQPLHFPTSEPLMLLLRHIRDSVHNFALSYNRKKRQMNFKK